MEHWPGERRKLLLSVGANFATRIPGAVGVLWFLPLLRFGLGTDAYTELLSALALGGALMYLSGGFNTVARRLIGEAYAEHHHYDEAEGFMSLGLVGLVALLVGVVVILGYGWIYHVSNVVLVVALLSAIGVFLNQFNDVRAAYNEHYVSGTSLIAMQTIFYSAGFILPATQRNVILGAMVIQGAYWAASLVALVLLIWKRPYLLRGRVTKIGMIFRQGTLLAVADGLLLATLSLSVVWLQIASTPMASAWFGTVVRLFQTFLTPVILLVLPISGYVRLLWNSKSSMEQRILTKRIFLCGMGYGALVAVVLWGVSVWYVDRLLHLSAPGNALLTGPVFLLFGTVVGYKSYTSIAYSAAGCVISAAAILSCLRRQRERSWPGPRSRAASIGVMDCATQATPPTANGR